MTRIVYVFFLVFVLQGCDVEAIDNEISTEQTDVSNDDVEVNDGTDDDPVENIFEGSVRLLTQQQVDSFGALDYTKVTGRMTLGYIAAPEADLIRSLEPLSRLISVGNIRIAYVAAESLEGLHNVQETQSLTLSNCSDLRDLDGLRGLTVIGKSISTAPDNFFAFWIWFNPKLESIEGLSGLTSAHEINIVANYSLTSLNGLENITQITGFYTGTNAPGVKIGDRLPPLPANETGNTSLIDFCALTPLLSMSTFNRNSYQVLRNAYNPSIEDIINGNCNL